MSFHGDGTRSNRYLLRPCSEFRLADHEFVSCYTPLREVSMVTFEKLFSPRFLMSRVLWYTGAGRFCVIERSGYKLRVFPTALSTALWLDRSERTDDERFLQTYLDSGDTFLDIGANIGTHALAAASRVGPAGRVVAFEPHPKTFGFLKQSIALNGFRNIETFCLGLGDVGGVYRFADDKCDDQNEVLESNDQAIAKSIDVQIACLDDFSFPRLALVKRSMRKDVSCSSCAAVEKHCDECSVSSMNPGNNILPVKGAAVGRSRSSSKASDSDSFGSAAPDKSRPCRRDNPRARARTCWRFATSRTSCGGPGYTIAE